MKKIIAMAFGALFITVAANAQIQRIQDSTFEKNRPAHRKMMVKENWNTLNLTDTQKEQMKKNQESFKKQREAVRNDASLTPEQKKAKMMELQKANREKNNKILTADQKATMKAKQKERHSTHKDEGQHNMKGRKGMKGEGMKGQGMKGQGMDGQRMKQLDLSQDQQAKMNQLRTKMQEQTGAINKNTKLTEEQKKQQIKDLRKNNMEQMMQILTPEQRKKMKETRGDNNQRNTRMKNRMEQSK